MTGGPGLDRSERERLAAQRWARFSLLLFVVVFGAVVLIGGIVLLALLPRGEVFGTPIPVPT